MRKSIVPIALAAAVVVPVAASAANAVPGFVAGQVTSAKGSKFVVQGQSGVSGVTLSKSTVVIENRTGGRGDLAKGACVLATGTRGKDGSVAADSVTVSDPGKGGCTAQFALRGRRPPAGQRPPAGRRPNGPRQGQPGRQFANRGFAAGSVASVSGSTLKVKGGRGSTTVVLSKSTRILKTSRAGASAVAKGACVLVRGTSADNGLHVAAQDVTVSEAGKNGCSFGFGGRGGPRGGRGQGGGVA